MRVVAISVAGPRDVLWRGRRIRTSIFKTPVSHRVHVTRQNVEGDEQSDLSVHGGFEKAVYAYPAEHYVAWRRELPGTDCPGARSVKTSPRKGCARKTFESAIAIGSVRLS